MSASSPLQFKINFAGGFIKVWAEDMDSLFLLDISEINFRNTVVCVLMSRDLHKMNDHRREREIDGVSVSNSPRDVGKNLK